MFTIVLSYAQLSEIASISSLDGGKASCNRKKVKDKSQGANICDGTSCAWISGEQGNDFGTCP